MLSSSRDCERFRDRERDLDSAGVLSLDLDPAGGDAEASSLDFDLSAFLPLSDLDLLSSLDLDLSF